MSTNIDAVVFVGSILIAGGTIMVLVMNAPLAIVPLSIAALGLAYVTLDVSQLTRWVASPTTTSLDPDREAVTLLRQRYAREEIDDEEFNRRLAILLETQTIEQANQYHEQANSPNEHGS
jgi:uncharacterized membrane protein